MAVAVKNNPETASGRLLDRLPVAVLVGVAYVLGSLALVFRGLPGLWGWLGLGGTYVSTAVLGVLMAAAALALIVFGLRLVGPSPMRGLRPGIAVGLVAVVLLGLVAAWLGFKLENWFYADRVFGARGWGVGVAVTAVIAGFFLFLLARLFLRPGFQGWLKRLDDQGWFSAAAYKRSQGQRVRRGTILGILALAGSGIYSMVERGSVGGATPSWEVSVPFTGEVRVGWDQLGDARKAPKQLDRLAGAAKRQDGWDRAAKTGALVFDRFTLRDQNDEFRDQFVRVKDEGGSVFDAGQVVGKDEFDAEKAKSTPAPTAEAPDGADEGPVKYAGLTLLPHVRYTLPLLLAGLAIWFAWRVVNLPVFADFLIATEAELNKVSWTTRKRLVQDTIVVLITVLLMAVFLFAADATWSNLLKLEWVGVLKNPRQDKKDVQDVPP